VDAGADALGFIFVEGTPRVVVPAVAAAIIRTLPPFVTPVGIFWDHPAGHVKAVAEACGLRALQFHGDESPEEVAQFTLPVIKTIKVGCAEDLGQIERFDVSAVLLDSPARWSEGERREPIQWELAARVARTRRVILSAGLTPGNVARAIAVARPYAVDVNSGVEARPGRKDPAKLRAFIEAARSQDASLSARPRGEPTAPPPLP
jgi:phosphoribosylanthranilate isomerase